MIKNHIKTKLVCPATATPYPLYMHINQFCLPSLKTYYIGLLGFDRTIIPCRIFFPFVLTESRSHDVRD